MNAEVRIRIEMGTRALQFSRGHPDADPGYAAATAKLKQLVARGGEVATEQRSGRVDVRTATELKRERMQPTGRAGAKPRAGAARLERASEQKFAPAAA